MTTTTGNEALFWQHIEDGDSDGAKQHLPTPAELLKLSADKYLDDAIASGEINRSRIYLDNRLGKFVGYTTVETVSGVNIVRTSRGDFTISAEYEEQRLGAEPGDYQDLQVEIELPVEGSPTVREDRMKVEGHSYTGDRGNRTLSKAGSDRVMGEVTKLIWQTFE